MNEQPRLPISELVTRAERLGLDEDDNPNVMPGNEYQALVRTLVKSRLKRFYVPVLVRPIPTYEAGARLFEIVDGVHRVEAWTEAAKVLERNGISVSHEQIPVVISDMTEEEARFYRLQLNRIRGNPDMEKVASELRALNASMGLDDLLDTGFEEHEIKHLLEAANADDFDTESILAGTTASFPDDEEEPEREKVFELTLRFETSDQLRKVKRALRKAAGKGNEMGDGLIRIIEGE